MNSVIQELFQNRGDSMATRVLLSFDIRQMADWRYSTDGRSRCVWLGESCLLENQMLRRVSASVLFTCLLAGAGYAQPRSGALYGYDLQGKPVARLATSGAKAVVLFFLATDCPVSNRYAPEIDRLEKEFAGKPVVFWLVYPNATETAEGVIHHQAAFSLAGATLVRPSQWFVAQMQATITPEAGVLIPEGVGWRTVYAGRIDNRYVDIGRERPKATRHDLEDAVEAVLAHQPVSAPGGPPVGCGIVSDAALGKR
jgi:thiol-disulfide isomerase/thioredoxin